MARRPAPPLNYSQSAREQPQRKRKTTPQDDRERETKKQTGRKMMLEDAAVTVDDVPAFHPRRLPLLLTLLTLLHLLML